MSNTFSKSLPVDFTIGIDPGYATQGLSVWDNRGAMPVLMMSKATVTDSSSDIWERVDWQFQRVRDVLHWLGQRGNVPLNCLLVLEEYHAAGKTSHSATYYRAFYDALFRERMSRLFRHAATIHAMAVKTCSMPETRKKNLHPVYDGSIGGVLAYMLNLWPELIHPSVASENCEFHQVEWLGKKPANRGTKGSWVAHASDAMVMSLTGMAAFVYPGMAERLNAKQREKIEAIKEIYSFHEEATRTFR